MLLDEAGRRALGGAADALLQGGVAIHNFLRATTLLDWNQLH